MTVLRALEGRRLADEAGAVRYEPRAVRCRRRQGHWARRGRSLLASLMTAPVGFPTVTSLELPSTSRCTHPLAELDSTSLPHASLLGSTLPPHLPAAACSQPPIIRWTRRLQSWATTDLARPLYSRTSVSSRGTPLTRLAAAPRPFSPPSPTNAPLHMSRHRSLPLPLPPKPRPC